ncbi:unnamed protein product, partial [Closterium sp. NIES-53]
AERHGAAGGQLGGHEVIHITALIVHHGCQPAPQQGQQQHQGSQQQHLQHPLHCPLQCCHRRHHPRPHSPLLHHLTSPLLFLVPFLSLPPISVAVSSSGLAQVAVTACPLPPAPSLPHIHRSSHQPIRCFILLLFLVLLMLIPFALSLSPPTLPCLYASLHGMPPLSTLLSSLHLPTTRTSPLPLLAPRPPHLIHVLLQLCHGALLLPLTRLQHPHLLLHLLLPLALACPTNRRSCSCRCTEPALRRLTCVARCPAHAIMRAARPAVAARAPGGCGCRESSAAAAATACAGPTGGLGTAGSAGGGEGRGR